MHDFRVSKVSGANGVLDIYRIQPVYNWIGNLLDGFPVHSVHIFITIYQANIYGQKPDFQTKYFRWNTDFSKVLFSVKHQVFKRNIFGGTPSFQTKYFRRRRDFSFYQRFLFNDRFFCNIFYYFQYLVIISI